MENYDHLVILGCGSIGGSLLKVGREELSGFQQITVIDRQKKELPGSGNLDFIIGDLGNPEVLKSALDRFPKDKFLVINLTEGIDKLAVRRVVSGYRAAYLDSGAGIIGASPKESRLSRLMPYHYTAVPGDYPQWMCWGINPGLIEIAARDILRKSNNPEDLFSIDIFENDQLHGKTGSGKIAVGWSPEGLVNEMTQTPTFEIIEGAPVESRTNRPQDIRVSWNGQAISGKKVAHEEIWNFGTFLKAWNSSFAYCLHSEVMEALKKPAREALAGLEVPSDGDSVAGLEKVAVRVTNLTKKTEACLAWKEEHDKIYRSYGINAVQFQTCRGIQLAIRLLQSTRLGRLAGNFCASNLPLAETDWQEIEKITREIEINWRPSDETGPVIINE